MIIAVVTEDYDQYFTYIHGLDEEDRQHNHVAVIDDNPGYLARVLRGRRFDDVVVVGSPDPVVVAEARGRLK